MPAEMAPDVVVAADHVDDRAAGSPRAPPTSGERSDSDAGCTCCPQPCFADGELGVRQRSNQGVPRKDMLLPAAVGAAWPAEEEPPQPGRPSAALQSRVAWLLGLLVCSLLVAALLPSQSSSGALALGGLWARLRTAALPAGPAIWELKWRLGMGPDPRPLCDTSYLGQKAAWPHGSADEFAARLGAGSVRRVAVVGNGPISEAQRREIEAADRIVRFNAMNNRRAGERTDVWVVRYNAIPPHAFWGFQQLEDGEVQALLGQARAVLFLGGSLDHNQSAMAAAVDRVRFWFPILMPAQAQQVDFNGYWDAYNRMFTRNGSDSIETADTMPSSGLLGLLAVLAAVGPETAVDLWGFNWSLRSYERHVMSGEELIIAALVARHPRVAVYPTACAGFYSCEPLCDTGQFRLAVDEQHCAVQVRKARAGEPSKFVDHHTIHNLDWYAPAKQEVERKLGPARPRGSSRPELEAWLARVAAALRNDTESPATAPAPAPGAAALAATWQEEAAQRFRRKLHPGGRAARQALG